MQANASLMKEVCRPCKSKSRPHGRSLLAARVKGQPVEGGSFARVCRLRESKASLRKEVVLNVCQLRESRASLRKEVNRLSKSRASLKNGNVLAVQVKGQPDEGSLPAVQVKGQSDEGSLWSRKSAGCVTLKTSLSEQVCQFSPSVMKSPFHEFAGGARNK